MNSEPYLKTLKELWHEKKKKCIKKAEPKSPLYNSKSKNKLMWTNRETADVNE